MDADWGSERADSHSLTTTSITANLLFDHIAIEIEALVLLRLRTGFDLEFVEFSIRPDVSPPVTSHRDDGHGVSTRLCRARVRSAGFRRGMPASYRSQAHLIPDWIARGLAKAVDVTLRARPTTLAVEPNELAFNYPATV